MTINLVAVEMDFEIGDVKPVIGYGFSSNGRYAQTAIIEERFIPRIMNTETTAYVDEAAGTIDPLALWAIFMSNEKPGGHGDRAHRRRRARHGNLGRHREDFRTAPLAALVGALQRW